MAYPIKFLLLQKPELIYEVAIRGEVPCDKVIDLRRQVTKLTQLYPSEDILETCFDFSEDVKGVSDTLTKIILNIDNLKCKFQNSLLERTRSLLHHLHFRILRINKPINSDEATTLKSLSSQFQNIFTEFSELISLHNLENSSTHNLVSGNSDEENPPENIAINVTCDRGVLSDLSKIKYDGKTCVRDLIQRLQEFKLAKGLQDSKMFSLAYDIFTGDALHWFRRVSTFINNWDMLLSKLKDDFDIPDYDYRMLAEIRNRTQGESESIVIYLAIMEGMFSRISRTISEEEKLEIILHNIRPCYSNILATCTQINNLETLRSLCRNFEKIKIRSDAFKEPPSITSKTLAPEFSYNYRSYNKTLNNFNSSCANGKINFNAASNSKVYAITPNKQYCFRCKDNSHSMRECKAERVIKCFRCGLKDVRLPECPNCNPKN